MNEILAVFGDLYIYCHGVVMAVACAAAICCMTVLGKKKGLSALSVYAVSLLSLILCPLLARFVYWYCCPGQFSGLGDAMTSPLGGGYSIAGAIPGVIISVLLGCVICREKQLADMFDAAAVSGSLAIAIGRLASFFTPYDKSRIIFEDERLCRLPFSVLVTDSATGVQSWRFATFIFESLAGYIIFGLLCFFMLTGRSGRGITSYLFCVLFGSSQAVLESTRNDALFLRMNGFVSLMQIIGLVMMLTGVVALYVLALRKTSRLMIKLCLPITVGLITAAGILEYLVQRYGNYYAVCYLFMSMCMISVSIIALVLLLAEGDVSVPGEETEEEESTADEEHYSQPEGAAYPGSAKASFFEAYRTAGESDESQK